MSRRPWKRRDADALPDPEYLFRELQRRELRDLETCRRVWEQEFDPLALCEAVRQVDLPEWLRSALLVMLIDRPTTKGLRPGMLWRTRATNAIDAIRAAEVAGVRTHPELPQTWEMAFLMGEHFARDHGDDIPAVSPEGAKRSYYIGAHK